MFKTILQKFKIPLGIGKKIINYLYDEDYYINKLLLKQNDLEEKIENLKKQKRKRLFYQKLKEVKNKNVHKICNLFEEISYINYDDDIKQFLENKYWDYFDNAIGPDWDARNYQCYKKAIFTINKIQFEFVENMYDTYLKVNGDYVFMSFNWFGFKDRFPQICFENVSYKDFMLALDLILSFYGYQLSTEFSHRFLDS